MSIYSEKALIGMDDMEHSIRVSVPKARQGNGFDCDVFACMYAAWASVMLRILQESQPAKYRNLSRLLSNLSRLKKNLPSACLPVSFPV